MNTTPTQHAPPQIGNDRDAVIPPTLGELLLRWIGSAAVLALLASLGLHLAGWQISRFIQIGPSTRAQQGGEDDGSVEMAILSQGELDAIIGSAIDAGTPSVPDALPEDVGMTADIPEAIGGEGELGGEPGQIGEVGDVGGGGDIGGGGEGSGLGGGGGGASFFGVEATGHRFAYIVDVSASMDDVRMNALRRELIRSVEALLETAQFMIIKYSSDAKQIGDVEGWQEASPAVRRAMRAHIDGLLAEANTFPVPGFEIVAARRPRPDAIYFMTDGEFSDDDTTRIIAMAKQMKVPVHGICLGSQEGETRMRAIARATKGTFTFVRLDR
ncbi:MAG: VWA domain-containing protein [Planctomycetota bacterium]|nr:VWA domain-containing protein [Planctomycetota bacterium]